MGALLASVIIGIIIIIISFLNFAHGWIIGNFIKWIFGATFISGLEIFGIHISPESIPLVCGTLAVIGSFFKSTTIDRKQDKEIF